jgi:hypothetical protein
MKFKKRDKVKLKYHKIYGKILDSNICGKKIYLVRWDTSRGALLGYAQEDSLTNGCKGLLT